MAPGGAGPAVFAGALARRLRRGNGDARGRDHGLAAARALLRLLDSRLGEPHRPRAARARARLLAGREARRPPAERAPPRLDRPRRGRLCRDPAVHHPADPRRRRPGPRRAVGGRGHRLVLRHAAALRAAGVRARDGVAVRHPAGAGLGGERRRGRRPALRALDHGQPARRVPPCADHDPADRDAADAHPRGGRARGVGGAAAGESRPRRGGRRAACCSHSRRAR